MAFTTGSDRDEPFSFLYIGDAQNDIKEHWSRVIRKAYTSLPNASFIIHAGDLIDHGDADEQWGGWFEAAGWLNGWFQLLQHQVITNIRGLLILQGSYPNTGIRNLLFQLTDQKVKKKSLPIGTIKA